MDVETSILGAGPYGLSIAAHLAAKRHPHRVFGSPMESWRRFMPEGMILKSEPFASNLWDPERRFTLERYCRALRLPYQPIGRPVDLRTFLQYADWFRQNTRVEPIDQRAVALRRSGHGFHLRFASGEELTSRRVVLATGHLSYAVLPPELAHLPEPQVTHSSRMLDVNSYAKRNVTIIGGGQSSLETAALLHEAGAQVEVLVRRGKVEWNEPWKPRSPAQRLIAPAAGIASGWKSVAVSELPGTFRRIFAPEKRHRFVAGSYGASGAWWLRNRVDGRIGLHVGSHIETASLADGRVLLRVAGPQGRRELITDHVIAATGYRVDVERLGYLDRQLVAGIRREAGGIPELSPAFETSIPGLFMVGVSSSPVFGPIMRFMYGAKHPAAILARRLH